jgi:hypothetical protein
VKIKFIFCGGGDRSVGIFDTDGTITIEDNLIICSQDEPDYINGWKQVIAENYDMPIRCVQTETEYLEELKRYEQEEAWEKKEEAA